MIFPVHIGAMKTAAGAAPFYQSNFSTLDGWSAAFNVSLDAGITFAGRSNLLRITCTSTGNATSYCQRSGLVALTSYIHAFDMYVPSTNAMVDGISMRGYTNIAAGHAGTLDAWVSVLGTASENTHSGIRGYMMDGADINPNSNPLNDVIYLDNYRIWEA